MRRIQSARDSIEVYSPAEELFRPPPEDSASFSARTSNTASANMIVPFAIAVARAAGVRPIEPALRAMLGASMGFMMPISIAPNAIVYSSGNVPITAMIRYGIALDLVAFIVIVLFVMGLTPLLF
jgi:sodium-dependent dicarboxylate transporter 2/3/5